MFEKKSILLFSILLPVTLFVLCGCDEDDSPTQSAENELVGTWALTRLTIVTEDGTTVLTESLLGQMGASWIIELNGDNTFESRYNLGALEIGAGTWSTSGNELTIVDSEGASAFEYSLDGNVLTLEWTDLEDGVEESLSGEFTKQ
jgi:hypothetical protein